MDKGQSNILLNSKVALPSLCTIKTGGVAENVYLPKTKEALFTLLFALKREGVTPIFLGNGSNVLFPDGIMQTPVIKTTLLTELKESGGTVYAGAGVPLPRLAAFCAELGLSGAEFLCGIPGTVGGAIVMNAGAFGQTVSDCLLSVETDRGVLLSENCEFSYRKSRFQTENICVLGAKFRFFPASDKDVWNRMQTYRAHRVAAQPTQPSAGSVFYQKDGTPAWKTVRALGLCGMRIGGAQISPKHANFIVNLGNATSLDVKTLISHVQTCAKKQLNVELYREIIYIGEPL